MAIKSTMKENIEGIGKLFKNDINEKKKVSERCSVEREKADILTEERRYYGKKSLHYQILLERRDNQKESAQKRQ